MAYVIGDIHGHYARFVALLEGVGLVGDDLAWTGGGATLYLAGDFTDRGPAGVEAIELAMRLEREAAAAGGRVVTLMGNHDLLLLAARRFGDVRTDFGDTFYECWLSSGGEPRDLARLSAEHLAWLAALPALVLEDDTLFMHGDCALYLDCGNSVEEVNRRFREIALDDDPDPLDALLDGFSEHGAFERSGLALAERTLRRFGGRRIVHGHTPIAKVDDLPAEQVREARVYHHGRCVNVDHGLYLDGPGFVLDLATLPLPNRPSGAGGRSGPRGLLG